MMIVLLLIYVVGFFDGVTRGNASWIIAKFSNEKMMKIIMKK